ncbi:MAG: site-2 protease family protein [Clostridia bacterium]|nr:site-2 protease family protein [Clostridia bacterium]
MGISALLNDPLGYLKNLLLLLPAILPALVLHEWGHAFVATKLGDPTPSMLGRLTVDPRKHIDPIGFISMLVIGLGWAKPVPINPRYYKHPRRDDFFVSIAGITMNLIQFAFGCVVLVALFILSAYGHVNLSSGTMYYVMIIVENFIWLNLSLAVFNLLPVPPLDGYHVINDLILRKSLFASPQAARIGQMILLALLWTGLLDKPLYAVKSWAYSGLINALLQFCRTVGIV